MQEILLHLYQPQTFIYLLKNENALFTHPQVIIVVQKAKKETLKTTTLL